jgi:hypothetical protein
MPLGSVPAPTRDGSQAFQIDRLRGIILDQGVDNKTSHGRPSYATDCLWSAAAVSAAGASHRALAYHAYND